MKVARLFAGRTMRVALAAVAVSGSLLSQKAAAQAPYLLPYTIQTYAGLGTAPAINATTFTGTCAGTNTVGGVAYDALGDGCPISSNSIVVGTTGTGDVHDVSVDAQGNVYFLDNQSNGFLRRIDARSGLVTAYAGSGGGSQPAAACPALLDKYGDGCTANDGRANAAPASGPYLYTTNLAKARGIAVARNGDVYIADYSGNVIHKISFATGTMTIVAGVIAGGTVAKPVGNIGQKGYTGDGGLATAAEENGARGVAVDAAGNVFIADSANNVIRKVTAATGIISTVVGVYPGSNTNAVAGSAGDGGPATSAQLSAPEDVEVDAFGNLYVADFGNSKVRMVYNGGAVAAKLIAATNPGVTPTVGNIYTIMGGGVTPYVAGTIVLATSTTVTNTRKIAIDARGNVYLYDNGSNVIWFLDATTGFMRVIAGTFGKTTGAAAGCPAQTNTVGDNCPGTLATLAPNSAGGVGVDLAGNVFLTDTLDHEIRRVSTNQRFPAVAFGASTSQVLAVHFAAGDTPAAINPYVLSGSPDYTLTGSTCTVNPDLTQDCLLTITFTPTRPGADVAAVTVTSTLNGTAILGISGTGTAASVALDPGATSSFATALKLPQGIAQDGAGNTYIADTGNNRVLKYTPAGVSTVIAGTGTAGYTGDNGLAAGATLNGPRAVAVARNGSIYIADTGNNVIRRVDPSTNLISTHAGGATATTICVAAVDTFGDGCPATQTTFSKPSGLAADIDGNVFVTDTGNNLIREITVGSYVTYIAGGASTVCAAGDVFGNGCAGNGALFNGPTGIALDAARNIYIADTGSNQVRKIASSNLVTNLAGTGASGASGNGGAATMAQLASPTGVAVDAGSNVYIADTGNAVVRLVNSLGIINTTIGTLGAPGTGTLPGSAFAVQLSSPSALVSTGQGRILVLDAGNSRTIVDDRGSVSYNFGRTNLTFSSPTLQIQETSTGSLAATLATPLFTTTGTTGSFTLAGTTSNGCTPSQSLAPGTSCLLAAQFTPAALGAVTATYTESGTNTINQPTPFITLSGTGAVLTQTTSVTKVTTPATGSPTYAVPFVVTTTATPASCNTAAPSCFPTGTVTFFVDGTQVGLAIPVSATGTASQSISGLSVGTHTIVAVYSGDSFYASSSAPALTVTIAQGITTAVVVATPATSVQFTNLVLTATVTGPIATSFPTGTVSFYAGTTLLGTSSINATNGIATLQDVDIPATKSTAEILPQSFNLPAGTYNLTVVYSGDNNYAKTTSAGTPLIISPQPAGFTMTLLPNATGTAQGSTGQTQITISPTNTVNGTITFKCTGMPANSDCTFSPTSLAFAPVSGRATPQITSVTLFTDVPTSVLPASMLGWPILLASLFGMLAFRKRLRQTRLFAMLALAGLLTGSSIVLTGCDNVSHGTNTTPIGVYNVTITATGPNNLVVTAPITFTVTAGIPGQL